MLIGITVAVIAACLLIAGFILTREKKAANEPGADETNLREIVPEEVAEKTAIPKETSEPVGALTPENTTEVGVPSTLLRAATAESITAAEDVSLTGPGLQVEEPLEKNQLTEILPQQHQPTTVPLDIAELKVTPVEARLGETVNISCKLTNMNDIPVYCAVTLRINGMVIATKETSLVRRSAEHMNFTVVATLPGDYKVDVNSLTGRLTILGETQQTFVCPNCGSRNDAGYQFCGGCGIRLAVGEQPEA